MALHVPTILLSQYPTMQNIEISANGVEKLKIEPGKTTGPDNIQAILLKETALEISPILTHIFNQSLQSGVLPSDWKEAHIVPVFKKGDKTKPENYRPISLTSIACKILEHIVVSSIMKHLDAYSILSSCQHGFRRNHSCEMQLLLLSQDLSHSYKRKKQMDMIMLDFSKAFDKVPHNRLLLKLRHYGIHDHNLNWIRAFLTNRQQSVVLEGAKSKAAPVGVRCSPGHSPWAHPLSFVYKRPTWTSLINNPTICWRLHALSWDQQHCWCQDVTERSWCTSKMGKTPGWCPSTPASVLSWDPALLVLQ